MARFCHKPLLIAVSECFPRINKVRNTASQIDFLALVTGEKQERKLFIHNFLRRQEKELDVRIQSELGIIEPHNKT